MSAAASSSAPAAPVVGQRPGLWAEVTRTAPVVIGWACLSVSLSYYNSWLLNRRNNRFPFPFFYTMWHGLFQLGAMNALFILQPQMQRPSIRQFRAFWRPVLVLAVATAVSIGGENAALTMVTLTVHESIKSAVPVLTMVLAFLFEGRNYTPPLILAVIGLALCTSLVTTGAINPEHDVTAANSPVGVWLTIAASVAAASKAVVIALLMREPAAAGEPPAATPLVVVWYEAMVTTPIYMLAWVCTFERDESLIFMQGHLASSILYTVIGSVTAIIYSAVVNLMIHLTSSLTSTVLGTAKHVGMTIVAAIFIDHVVQQSNGSITLWLGLLCYIPFTFAYAHLMLTHQGVDGSASVQSVRDMCCCAAWRRKPATTNEASALLEGKAP